MHPREVGEFLLELGVELLQITAFGQNTLILLVETEHGLLQVEEHVELVSQFVLPALLLLLHSRQTDTQVLYLGVLAVHQEDFLEMGDLVPEVLELRVFALVVFDYLFVIIVHLLGLSDLGTDHRHPLLLVVSDVLAQSQFLLFRGGHEI